jgi:hypothetical protein
MKKMIRLNEDDLRKLVTKIIKETKEERDYDYILDLLSDEYGLHPNLNIFEEFESSEYYDENLKESNINKIYIWFDFSIIESVLKNGVAFKSNDDSRYKYNLSISTTRNPKWRWGGGNCRITLDRNQISKIYKIVPYSHFGFKEWEERIFTNKNIKYLPSSFFIKIELDESLKKNILPPTNIEIEYTDFKKSRIDAYGARYILPKNQIKKFESFAEYDIDDDYADAIK